MGVRMSDDRPGCESCRHSARHRPEFLSDAAPYGLVCTHSSAKRLNGGSVWAASLAREVCKGRRYEQRR